MTRTVQTLPPSCPLEIRGQVAGAGRCPLVAAALRQSRPECGSDLRVCLTGAAFTAGAPRGQVGGSSEAAPAGIRGQLGAGRGQQKTATCPLRIRPLTWGFLYQGAVRAALSRKFGSSPFAKSHIAPHIDHSLSRFLSPQKSCPENLPFLPPSGPVRTQWTAAKHPQTRAGPPWHLVLADHVYPRDTPHHDSRDRKERPRR